MRDPLLREPLRTGPFRPARVELEIRMPRRGRHVLEGAAWEIRDPLGLHSREAPGAAGRRAPGPAAARAGRGDGTRVGRGRRRRRRPRGRGRRRLDPRGACGRVRGGRPPPVPARQPCLAHPLARGCAKRRDARAPDRRRRGGDSARGARRRGPRRPRGARPRRQGGRVPVRPPGASRPGAACSCRAAARPAMLDARLRTWPALHARFAVVGSGAPTRLPSRSAGLRGSVFWVTARAPGSQCDSAERRGRAPLPRERVRAVRPGRLRGGGVLRRRGFRSQRQLARGSPHERRASPPGRLRRARGVRLLSLVPARRGRGRVAMDRLRRDRHRGGGAADPAARPSLGSPPAGGARSSRPLLVFAAMLRRSRRDRHSGVDLVPGGWDELEAELSRGLAGVSQIDTPYAGSDPWTRLGILAAVPLAVSLAMLFAFWPAGSGRAGRAIGLDAPRRPLRDRRSPGRRRARSSPAAPLLFVFVGSGPVAAARLVAARCPGRGHARSWRSLVALPLAARVDASDPLISYTTWSVFGDEERDQLQLEPHLRRARLAAGGNGGLRRARRMSPSTGRRTSSTSSTATPGAARAMTSASSATTTTWRARPRSWSRRIPSGSETYEVRMTALRVTAGGDGGIAGGDRGPRHG